MTDLFEQPVESTTSLDLRRQQRDRRRSMRRIRTLVATAIAMVVLAMGASFAWNYVQTFGSDDNGVADFEGAGQGTVQVVIEPGASGADIATALHQAGVVASEEAFLLETYANPDVARGITPGYYLLPREMKAEFALNALLDPGYRNEISMTFIEGNILSYYFEKIASHTEFSIDEVEAAAEDTDALGLPAEADGNLEGWLFPATYKFNPDVTPEEVLSTMIQTTVRTLDDLGVAEGDRQRVLTIASIVERESKLTEDRAKVASVIYNRLEAGMALQMDSTITYLAKSFGDVDTTAEQREIDSPYNTYINVGLPPAPIAGPGLEALEGTVDPADTDFFFFVPINLITGETVYAETYPEHLENVDSLLEWRRENGE